MGRQKVNQETDSWDLSPINIPHCNGIISPPPIGIGTPYVEAFTSLFARCAEAHHVTSGALFIDQMIPHLTADYLKKILERGGTGLYKSSWTWNGTRKNAELLSSLFGYLTDHKDLDLLTMHPWRDVIPDVGLLRKERAWCTDCFREAWESGGTIYEPLMWATKPVEICSIHRKYLSTECPHCKVGSQPVLSRKTWPGYCSKCGSWLGHSDINDKLRSIKTDDLARLEWVTKCVGALIAATPKLERRPERRNVMDGIVQCVKQYCDGNIAKFSHELGAPKNTAWMWHQGLAVPSLETLIAICGRFAIDIVKFLGEGQIATVSTDPSITSSFKLTNRSRKRPSRAALTTVEDMLKSISESKTDLAPSMQEVAAKIQHSKRLLYKYFPALCKQISQNYRRKVRNRRLSRIKKGYGEVRGVILELRASGIEPKYSEMRRRLISPGILREKSIRAAWFDTMRDLKLVANHDD